MSIINGVKHRLLPLVIAATGFLALFPQNAYSQGLKTAGENTDLCGVRGNAKYPLPSATGGAWRADSLWIGPTFQRDTTKSFKVWFAQYFKTQATYKGKLYLMLPRPNLPDTAIFLFRNRCNAVYGNDSSVDLTSITKDIIHHMDTVYFMYRSDSGTSGPADCGNGWALGNDFGVKQTDSLFTGPNRAPYPLDATHWTQVDRHYSFRDLNAVRTIPGAQQLNMVVDSFFSLNRNTYVKYGRRWCAAGWIHQDTIPRPRSNIRTDTVEFGFEDQYNGFSGSGGGMFYNDIRFNITGVLLSYPLQIDSITLRLAPSVDTIAAGDSISIKAFLWGRDTTPDQNLFVDSTDLAQKVTWQVIKSPQSASFMRLGAGPSNVNTFKAATAYEWDTVVVSYLRVQKKKAIYVKPGPDYRVWIEPDSAIDVRGTTPAMIARLQKPDSVASDTITSLQNQISVFGVIRDAYGNFTRFANNSQWAESPAAGIVTVANGAPSFVGVITRGNVGTTTVLASGKNLVSNANLLSSTVKVTVIAIPLNNLINDQTFSIAERSVAGTMVGTVAVVVPASVAVTLTPLTTVPAFTFDPTTRRITVAAGAILTYKTQSSYSFKVVAKAANALDDTATITIQLIALIPIANLIDDQVFSVKEKSSPGTVVGTVVKAKTVLDSVQLTFTPISSAPEFTFDPATKIVTVAPGAVLNYDTKSSYSFKLAAVATNAYSLIDTATITIQLVADSLIPATATLLDTNHDGHLDMIDIQWTDPSVMKSVLPAVGDLVRSVSLITIDKQNDALHAIALVPDFADKIIHIILQENTQVLETGWDSAKVSLSTVSVSVKGGYFQVTGIIDGAAPIVTAACYSPGDAHDSLAVTFSEPVDASNAAAYIQTIKIITKNGTKSLADLGASQSGITKSQIQYVAPPGAISPYENSAYLSFSAGPPSPAVVIDYCHPLPLIVTGKAGPNPFDPNIAVPPGRHDGDPLHGIRIEILLNSSNTSSVGGDNRPATCSIFDAVGNVIMNEVSLKPDPVSVRKKYVIWDGKNKNGMSVAGGTYLARITVEDKKTGSKVVKQILLGVKTVK